MNYSSGVLVGGLPHGKIHDGLVKYGLYGFVVALIVTGATIACASKAKIYLLHLWHFSA